MRRGLAIERRSRSDRRRPRSSTNVGTSIAARYWAEMVLDWNHCMGHPVRQPIPSSVSARGACARARLTRELLGIRRKQAIHPEGVANPADGRLSSLGLILAP